MGRWARTWAGVALAALGGAAGCRFDGEPGVGYRCEIDGDCPPGQVCQVGFCGLAGEGGGDGGAPGAADGGDGGGGVGVELVDNGDMEDGPDGWTPYNADLDDHDEPYEGEQSLEVCSDAADDVDAFSIFQDLIVRGPEEAPLTQGARYRARAFVRALPAGPDPPTVHLGLRERGGATLLVDHDGPAVTMLGEEWTRLEVTAAIQEPDRDTFILIVWGREGDRSSCFLVDSVSAVELAP
ncbi:MAG TPA: hypothetical protein VKZ63_11110 [Kofleriaceae bacterium]|nr:hypothetical protein [Kofleriaceae bacterium]